MAVQSPLLPRLGASFWTTVAIGGLVLVSGAALTWVGLAGLRQELAVAERRDRDDSERAAERVVRSLESTLGAWLAGVAAIPAASPTATRDGMPRDRHMAASSMACSVQSPSRDRATSAAVAIAVE